MDEQQHEQLVLTAEERAGCMRVAAGEGPHSQRAQAVLALADGATLAEAAMQAGLTENQVKHWQGRFRHGRLAIFPEDVLAAEGTPVAAPIPVVIESLPALGVTPTEKPDKKEKKKEKNGAKKKKGKGKKDKKKKDKKQDKKGKKKKKK